MIKIKRGKPKFISTTKIHPLIKPITSILLTIILALLMYYTFTIINPLKICNDDTPTGKCSSIKPFYCEDGKLIERASICGCSKVSYGNDESCITEYQNNSKEIQLKYVLNEKMGEIHYTVYRNLIPYLINLPQTIKYDEEEMPLREDFKLKKINEEIQKEMILPLIIKIQEITPNKKDQFRIAVSMVQMIPYEVSQNLELIFGNKIPHQRYPYEVLYEQKGICGEKSELLALLLKELGYETIIFFHQKENHESVGIKCPIEFSMSNSGYCYIETTGSSIITNNKINFIGGITLKSEPEIMLISKGNALDKNMYEYKDARVLEKIDEKIKNTGRLNPLEGAKLNELKKKYQLAESYNPI